MSPEVMISSALTPKSFFLQGQLSEEMSNQTQSTESKAEPSRSGSHKELVKERRPREEARSGPQEEARSGPQQESVEERRTEEEAMSDGPCPTSSYFPEIPKEQLSNNMNNNKDFMKKLYVKYFEIAHCSVTLIHVSALEGPRS